MDNITEDFENELKKIMSQFSLHENYPEKREIFVNELTKDSVKNPYFDETRGLRFNDEKIRYDLIPPLAHRECAKVWTKGLDKYPAGNWEKGMPWSEVIASALRHLEAIRLGEDIDTESGLLHAAHLQCNAQMLTEYYFTKKEFDNRKKYETK